MIVMPASTTSAPKFAESWYVPAGTSIVSSPPPALAAFTACRSVQLETRQFASFAVSPVVVTT